MKVKLPDEVARFLDCKIGDKLTWKLIGMKDGKYYCEVVNDRTPKESKE